MNHSFAGNIPEVRGEEEEFYKYCRDGQLRIQRCRNCRAYTFYPGAVCRSCTSTDIEWVDAAGTGVVHSFSWVHRPVPGYESQAPYNVSIIELTEGVRLMSRVMCDQGELRCDLPVRVEFAQIGAEFAVPVFVPDPSASAHTAPVVVPTPMNTSPRSRQARADQPLLAIVAGAEAPSADSGRLSPAALMAEASAAAIAQAGLRKQDIDGLWSASAYYYMPTLSLAEHLGIRPRYSDSTTIGGSSFVAHLRHAAAAIAAGMCDIGLIAYGSTQRTDGNRTVKSMSEPSPYEVPYGLAWPITGYGLMAQRHMHMYGTKPEHLAEIAVAAREWAVLNPDCAQTKSITRDDVLSSPMVSSPLHRLDCCLVTNGGGALVVTTPERARDLCDDPIYVWGAAESHHNRYISAMPDFTSSPTADTAAPALAQAGVSHADVDTYHLYDAFTIAVLVMLEGLGLCGRGEAGAFVEDGKLRPGGALAVNTNGGGLSCRHPGMLGIFLVLEAITQLRGRGGPRQVGGAQCALVHGLGGVHMSGVTAVLGGPRWRM